MMVGATPQQQQQEEEGTTVAPSAEDEALKRNTDCVYFLTSPLACKKGAECEYRHSEYARINPRDCYFWLNGSCLNSKCGFRHPPLDGLLGSEAEPPVGSFIPPIRPAIHAPQNPAKAPVQCIYFQRGYCARGDKCGFLHGLNPSSSKTSQQVVPAPSTALPPTKPHISHQKLSQEVRTQQANFAKAVEASVDIKPAPKQETGSRRNGIDRNPPPSKTLQDEVPKYKATDPPLAVNGNPIPSRYNRVHQFQVSDDHGISGGKDAEEFLRESSPGFDVLVDDELRNSDFYHGEDQYGRSRGEEGRNLDHVDEYDTVDYSLMGDMDQDKYHNSRDYDLYNNSQEQYAWEQRRPSSESRGYSKGDTYEPSDGMDLRYRLSKHRRGSGLRSVVSHDVSNVEDRVYRGSSPRESSISSRLHGRIKLPRSPRSSDLHIERERDNRARSQGILSAVKPHQGRLRDRIKAPIEENYDSDSRNPRGARIRRDMVDDRSVRFAGPKSLAELKGTRNPEQSLRKRKNLDDNQLSEGDLSFKGPMPLSEILKRKRSSEASGTATDKPDNNQKEVNTTVGESQSDVSSVKNEANKKVVGGNKSESINVENEVAGDKGFSEPPNRSEPETESRMVDDNGVDDQEYEGDDQREGEEYEYEQVDEGEYYEEGENAEAEHELDDDEDDFAKKIGVVFS